MKDGEDLLSPLIERLEEEEEKRFDLELAQHYPGLFRRLMKAGMIKPSHVPGFMRPPRVMAPPSLPDSNPPPPKAVPRKIEVYGADPSIIQQYWGLIKKMSASLENMRAYNDVPVNMLNGKQPEGDVSITRLNGSEIVRIHHGGLEQRSTGVFAFQLIREGWPSQTIVDESLITGSIEVYNSSMVLLTPTITYSATWWTIDIPEDQKDPAGYWVNYNCTNGIATQYPRKYKTADKWAVGNRVQPGRYVGMIPYWEVTDYESPSTTEIATGDVTEDFIYDGYYRVVPAGYYGSILIPKDGIYQFGKTVRSSVPYGVYSQMTNGPGTHLYYGLYSYFNEFEVQPGGIGASWDPGYHSGIVSSPLSDNELAANYSSITFPNGAVYSEPYPSPSTPPTAISELYAPGGRNHFFIMDPTGATTAGWTPGYGTGPYTYGPELTYKGFTLYSNLFDLTLSYNV